LAKQWNFITGTFKKEYLPKVKGFPKVRQQIRRGKKRIALASSAKEEELTRYKEIAQINELIAGETSFDDVERSKLCPDIFEAALKQLGNITPDNVIVVGDTPYDAAATAKANVNSIGVLCSGWTQPQLLRAGCSAV
jgi:HAD superfamily hydrolase (TIGR01549 family)